MRNQNFGLDFKDTLWRFIFQIKNLGNHALGPQESTKKIELIYNSVLQSIHRVHTIKNELLKLIEDYKLEMEKQCHEQAGKENLHIFDQTMEVKINHSVIDFINSVKRLWVVFSQCEFVDDETFKLEKYMRASLEKIEKQKATYVEEGNGIHLPIISLVLNSSKGFMSQINELRGKIEHENFDLGEFRFQIEDNKLNVVEPQLIDMPVSEKISFFYNKCFDFLEKVLAYYLGKKGEQKSPGFLKLTVDNNYNYKESQWKYNFAFGDMKFTESSEDCDYS